ncbi:hypothetical protein NDU88_004415 [Pleurodeles waltl]|uniref:Uncharacterized protein n=1 Tax=Pleurodeles waltl TaxID=8319 RepID=A0AAV7MTI3_PLEWA|nr:hypothetical protein NDU88_004415 [Pleurodeles waltl]
MGPGRTGAAGRSGVRLRGVDIKQGFDAELRRCHLLRLNVDSNDVKILLNFVCRVAGVLDVVERLDVDR